MLMILIGASSLFLFSNCLMAQGKIESLKAAYIFYFVRFTEWHFSVKRNDSEEIILCYDGSKKLLERELRSIAKKSKDSSTKLDLIVLDEVSRENIKECDMTYFSDENYNLILGEGLDTSGLLVITHTKNDKIKGVINFSLDRSRLSFEIDRRKARRSKLEISSKLLTLANKVKK